MEWHLVSSFIDSGAGLVPSMVHFNYKYANFFTVY